MRSPRIFITFTMFLILSCSQALAADTAQNETDAIINDIQKRLDLTNEQLEKLKPIIKEKHEKLKQKLDATLEQGFVEYEELSQQLKEISSQLEQKANDFLSSDEMTKFKEYLNNLDKESVTSAKESLIEEFEKLLDLTEEQAQKAAPALDEFLTRLSGLIASAMSSGEKSLEDFQIELNKLRNQLRDKLNDILNEQQMKKFEEHENHLEEGIQRAIFKTEDVGTQSV